MTNVHMLHGAGEPSPWVVRFARLIRARGTVLDLACGAGRHARWLAAHGYSVIALDRDAEALKTLAGVTDIETMCADLEDGSPWPLGPRRFAGIVVTNYLHRALFPSIIGALEDGGILNYETFAIGNERFGRPRNPDHLLREGELLEVVRGHAMVIAYEHVELPEPRPAVVQRICARRIGAAR